MYQWDKMEFYSEKCEMSLQNRMEIPILKAHFVWIFILNLNQTESFNLLE